MTPHVVIVGGGVSGLAAARALRAAVPEAHLTVTVLEASARVGGKVRTERVPGADGQGAGDGGGYVLEHGPDLFLTRKPDVAALCGALGLALEPTTTQPRRTYVLRQGRLFEMPEGLSGLVPARIGPLLRSPLLSWRGRLRALAEPLVPAWRGGDLTVERFLARRMGAEAYNTLVAPLLSGVYGDGAVLSTDATVPELRALERRHGSLGRAFWAQRRAAPAAPASGGEPAVRGGTAFASVPGGLETLVERLRADLPGVTVRTGAPVRRIARDGAGYAVELDAETLRADAVLVALPANAAAPLLAGLDGDLAAPLAAIPHEGVALATLAFARADVPHPLDAHGYLVPPNETGAVRAVTWTTSKFGGRAPEGVALFRLFFRAPGAVGEADDVLVARASDELARTLGARGTLLLTRVSRWPAGLPRYTLGHPARVAAIEARLAEHAGLFLAGPSLRGAGLPDAVRQSHAAAHAVLAFLSLP